MCSGSWRQALTLKDTPCSSGMWLQPENQAISQSLPGVHADDAGGRREAGYGGGQPAARVREAADFFFSRRGEGPGGEGRGGRR